jgi:hypothetical protein
MIEGRCLGGETRFIPSQAILAGELTEEHGDEMIPGTEAVGMMLGFCLCDGFLEFKSRKHLQHLSQYGMIMSHSPTPSPVIGYD